MMDEADSEQTDGQEASQASRGYKVRKIALLCFLGLGALWVAGAIAAVVISLDSPSGSSDSAGVEASEADAERVDESQLAATDAPDRKHVKVVAYASQRGDYTAFEHPGHKYYDSYRIHGTEVYEYDLPENSGMRITLSDPKEHDGGDVSLKVYEDGVLIKEKSGGYYNSASVWYAWKWSRA